MDALPNLASDGTASLQIAAYNPAQAGTTLQVDVDVAGTIVKHETLTVPAGGVGQYNLNEKLPDAVQNGKAGVRVSQAGAPLLNYTTYFSSRRAELDDGAGETRRSR